MDLHIFGNPPRTQELADALMVAAEALERDKCYAFDGRFHFMVEEGWSIAVSSDSADRLRVESCRLSSPKTTMWVLANRHDRLTSVATKMLNEVLEHV
jgi:hypothetical protein